AFLACAWWPSTCICRSTRCDGVLKAATVALSVLMLACSPAAGTVSDPVGDMPPGQQRTLSRVEIRDDWPFVPGAGTLACQDGAVAFRAGGSTYALNDAARARGYASIEPLRMTQSAPPTNPLRRLRQEERTRIFGELSACRTVADARQC